MSSKYFLRTQNEISNGISHCSSESFSNGSWPRSFPSYPPSWNCHRGGSHNMSLSWYIQSVFIYFCSPCGGHFNYDMHAVITRGMSRGSYSIRPLFKHVLAFRIRKLPIAYRCSVSLLPGAPLAFNSHGLSLRKNADKRL